MVVHQEFQNAGQGAGLMIWRIENMDLKPVPKNLYGNFYTGDAYIILYTSSSFAYNIHMWLGSECSQDESGAAAILATQLDEYLGGKPRQYRERQNYESDVFHGYFKGVKYQKGGVASGFKHVVTNDVNVKRLLHVKGRRVVRATEVEFTWSSFNKNDCFIIDAGANIYQWYGSGSNRMERIKSTQLAIGIRDTERMGRAKIYFVNDGEEPAVLTELLGPKPDIPEEALEDVAVERSLSKAAKLWVVSDADGTMKTSEVASKNPFQQEMLLSTECYILDNGSNGKVFLWKGKQSNAKERKAALKTAEEFISMMNYLASTQVQIFPEGGETMYFKQFFSNWKDKEETEGPTAPYVLGKIAKIKPVPFDVSTLHQSPAMAAQYGMVDDGSGAVQIWRVEGGDKKAVDPKFYGQFYGGDCYLILYDYTSSGRKNSIIYTWQGSKATQDELAASAFLTVQLDSSRGGLPVQVRVTQGQEPPHLVSLFKGKTLIIHAGGTSRQGGQTASADQRLFHVRMSSNGAKRAVEVKRDASSLNSNDAFVLKAPQETYIWKGTGATEDEINAAKYVASILGGKAVEVQEGKEPGNFWLPLGGKKGYQTSTALKSQILSKSPRLFGCSNKTGRLIVEEVPGDFTQDDLATDDVMLLDTWDQLFLWIGKDANEVEKQGSPKLAQQYIDTDPAERKGTPVVTVKQGNEPPTFTGWFMAWDSQKWDTDPLQQIQATC
ncbi:gelsolin [Latimeria chalumnae]|uniref:Macrophage-capping protein n=1 Tax=Latimeria chalumnae TaxID=7897 RepID=H3A9Y4_LATCH|nr:PREDICTED: gelsolin-like [Latimeria chalumnae]XP_014347272.1 PREDICTED: gelsolin-like [Latimeria chalumnae]|eukprot:XP_006001649.1 PREDICTED: gelsolin-like [Latimeria chalumnae]